MSPAIQITGAGAGTGKTHHLCHTIAAALENGTCRPGAFIATTFTRKAATELTGRVRAALLKAGLPGQALRVDEALVGTVHSVCARLLERFAFDAGISPGLRIMEESAGRLLLGGAVEECFGGSGMGDMEMLALRLGQTSRQGAESQWRQQVHEIIACARSNGIGPAALQEMGEASVSGLLAQLRAPDAKDQPPNGPEPALSAAVETALQNIRGSADDTKTTAACVAELETALASLRDGRLTWPQWAKLADLKAAKASQPLLAEVRLIAGNVEAHPGLHDDLRAYITAVFRLAAGAVEAYQRRKQERGMLDFTDLEVLTLNLLEQPRVQECVREEFDLLVVDEFQDTSPIQLALFVRLAALVKAAHWVGDTKQAIYGFRGCDPELMRAAEAGFTRGVKPAALNESRRHRPELVALFNGLFPRLFGGTDAAAQAGATLHACRRGHPGLPLPLELWALSSGQLTGAGNPAPLRSPGEVSAVARGIRELMDGGLQVSDRNGATAGGESLRPLRWRDIAVLCRTNSKASALAVSLLAQGIPPARRTAGLLAAPEAVLALACLRWLHDARDTVAVAEIVSLEHCLDAEVWLNDRLDRLSGGRAEDWGLGEGPCQSAVLGRIVRLRERMVCLTPAELLDAVLVQGDISGLVSQWGPGRARVRRANLDALRGLAAKYETECLASGSPAGHAGFLIWLAAAARAGEDCPAFDESADAVQIMTWHGSKGLEWPVVIVLDSDDEPRPRLWDAPLVSSAEAFDPGAPLGGRQMVFRPYPFGAKIKNVALRTRVDGSPAGLAALREAEAEQSRLLYVAMTRARDLLIFPLRPDKAVWLPEGVACPPLQLQGGNPDTAAQAGRRIRPLTPADDAALPAAPGFIHWYPPPEPVPEFLPAMLKPSTLPPCPEAVAEPAETYRGRFSLPAGQSDAATGTVLHAVIASYLLNPGASGHTERAARLCRDGGTAIDPGEAVRAAGDFHDWIRRTFPEAVILVEVPFTSRNAAGQRLAGFMDLVLLTGDGAVLIDHKTFQGGGLEAHAARYTGQLAAYGEALRGAGHRVHSTWIHFSTEGKMVRIQLPDQPS